MPATAQVLTAPGLEPELLLGAVLLRGQQVAEQLLLQAVKRGLGLPPQAMVVFELQAGVAQLPVVGQ
jgi:hypothetical protein